MYKLNLRSITSKILVSYLAVVFCSTTIAALSFHSILYTDLEKRTQMGLMRQARDIASLLSFDNPDLDIFAERLHRRQISVFFAGRTLESNQVVTDTQGIIVYSSLPEQFPPGKRLEDIPLRLHGEKPNGIKEVSLYQNGALLAVQAPIGPVDNSKGTVFAFANVSALKALNMEFLVILIKSFIIATAIAIPLGLLLGRYLTKPFSTLREYAQSIAKRRFDVRLDLQSDDELADLAATFNEMAVNLEKYDLSMQHFFQSASHELKTPLMSIQGYAEGVKEGVFQGDQAERALDVISRECQRLKTIVDEMINISRLQVAGKTHTLTQSELKSILDEAADSLRGCMIDKPIEIIVDVSPELKLIGDPEKLYRLFGNLMANATRYAKSWVRVSGGKMDGIRNINILVQDDGEGFSPQDLEHAFDYFYKGHGGDTGLGLSISRIIVEELGGTIKVNNSSEGGALVEVILPCDLS